MLGMEITEGSQQDPDQCSYLGGTTMLRAKMEPSECPEPRVGAISPYRWGLQGASPAFSAPGRFPKLSGISQSIRGPGRYSGAHKGLQGMGNPRSHLEE